MPATAREQNHAENRAKILRVARDHLRRHGAAELSLRKVIGEVGMVSSAIYRYFPSRDALLTALIIESYDALAERLEAVREATPAAQFRSLAGEFAAWAREHPQDFALIYGSPIPDYQAPQETVPAAARVARPFFAVVADAEARGGSIAETVSERLRAQGQQLGPGFALKLSAGGAVVGMELVAQLIGLLTLELYGHLRGTFDPGDDLIEHAIAAMAARLTM